MVTLRLRAFLADGRAEKEGRSEVAWELGASAREKRREEGRSRGGGRGGGGESLQCKGRAPHGKDNDGWFPKLLVLCMHGTVLKLNRRIMILPAPPAAGFEFLEEE